MYGYEYPPSKQILEYGPLAQGSHFYAEGKVVFQTQGTFDCSFEVGYTQDCKIAIVLYLNSETTMSIFGQTMSDKTREALEGAAVNDKEHRTYSLGGKFKNIECSRIYGECKYSGYKIEIASPHLHQQPWPVILGGLFGGYSSVFTASNYKIISTRTKDQPNEYEIIGLNYPEKAQGGAFPLSSERQLYLKITKKFDERVFNNEVVAELTVPDESVQAGWHNEDIADLWCALVSLATGRDIQWVTQSNYRSGEQIWQHKRHAFGGRITHAFINDSPLYLDDVFNQLGESSVYLFVRRCFESIYSNRVSLPMAAVCTDLIRRFVEYLMITGRAEDQARLVATSVEELLDKWEEHHAITPDNLVNRNERSRLINIITSCTTNEAQNYLDDRFERAKIISEWLENVIRKEIRRPFFSERLKALFAATERFQPPSNLGARIKSFIDTRDKIVHEGRFAELPITKAEYRNMVMMIPLMIFAIFDYDGSYIDLTTLES